MFRRLSPALLLVGAAALAAPGSLPDYSKQLETGKCEISKYPPGADSTYTGEITITGDTFEGVELWHLNANSKWKAKGGASCVVVTPMSGSTAEVAKCPSCDLAIHGKAEVDLKKTTCPPGLWSEQGVRRWWANYAFEKKAGGELTVWNNDNGRVVGTGRWEGDKMVYKTKHSCRWF